MPQAVQLHAVDGQVADTVCSKTKIKVSGQPRAELTRWSATMGTSTGLGPGCLRPTRRTCPNLEVSSVQAAAELALPKNEDKQSFVWGAIRKTGADLGEHSSSCVTCVGRRAAGQRWIVEWGELP